MTENSPTTPDFSAATILSTLNEDGSRRWLNPRPSAGRFLTARRMVAYGLILVFTLIPYIRSNGKPWVLLDVATRHFTIFGRTFLPTDTLLLALFMLGVFVTIFLFTALLGRVWCGWGCPQTVYMEFVFRPIERLFDGTPGRARKGRFVGTPLATGLKYLVYLLISCFLAHTFLAYFVGVETLSHWVRRSPFEHPASFLIMVGVTALMLFDFGFFREQTCIVACPYGRFQSVMLDRDSLIVSYDRGRGEPRGRAKARTVSLPIAQPAADKVGDCVDCGLCVTTCPTGIDIRAGLQMECIHCAQCIDACDAVMTKLHRPKGLIRYTSQSVLAQGRRRWLRPRVVIYPAILAVIAAAFGIALAGKGPVDMTLLRARGAPFVRLDHGLVGNNASVKLVNRTDVEAVYRLHIEGAEHAELRAQENPVRLKAGESRAFPVMLIAPFKEFHAGTLDVTVTVTGENGDRFKDSAHFRLVGPMNEVHDTREEHDS